MPKERRAIIPDAFGANVNESLIFAGSHIGITKRKKAWVAASRLEKGQSRSLTPNRRPAIRVRDDRAQWVVTSGWWSVMSEGQRPRGVLVRRLFRADRVDSRPSS
jgi:hypothetical protein